MVQQRGDRDADGLHLREHGVVVGEPAAAELLSGELAALSIRIRDAHQIGIPQKAEHPRVVPAHVADADHPDLDWDHGVGRHQRRRSIGGRLSAFSRNLPLSWGEQAGPARSAALPWL